MFRINRLLLEIISGNVGASNEKYGFDIPFHSGLNIIAGQNSKGKSTIGSCIYYALGMEELLELGASNEKALGKALKKEFEILNSDSGEIITHKILYSRILIEIVNDRGEIATIIRFINSNDFDKKGNDKKTKKAMVYFSAIGDISADVKSSPLFLRNHNNNADDYGFYHWLAEFIGLDLPEVVNNSVKGKSTLYLQAIFTALFIEQTKGWSEFLATMPFFGITKAKEKVIEFLLNLKELSISTERDDIEKEEKRLTHKWDMASNRLDLLASEFSGRLGDFPEQITGDPNSLNITSLLLKDEEAERTIQYLYKRYDSELTLLLESPVKRVGENKAHIRVKLEELYDVQLKFMKKFEDFDLNLNLQKSQYENISKHLNHINKELSAQKGIQNIIEESLLVTNVYDKCPTCLQTVSDDLMRAEGVTIEKYTLDQNISYLSGQQKIIKSSISSLSTIIEEKEVMRKYYLNKQRQLEEEIKIILRELIDDDREYSDVDSLKRVRLEKEVNDLRYGQIKFEQHIQTIKSIAKEYRILLRRKNELEGSAAEDMLIIREFETVFKRDYLFQFGYESNQSYNIYIQKDEPFKYFPVFKFSADSQLPQSIKTNSSASDFVRTLWAYSLSLLTLGRNHPGLLLLDEPGQHSVSSQSLKGLFEKSAAIKDKQVIIFTSIQKVLLKDGEKEIDALDLDSLLVNLKIDEDYHMYKLPKLGKSINLLS